MIILVMIISSISNILIGLLSSFFIFILFGNLSSASRKYEFQKRKKFNEDVINEYKKEKEENINQQT